MRCPLVFLALAVLCPSTASPQPSAHLGELGPRLGKTATVAFFLSPECPMCLQYPDVLKSLQTRWMSDSVAFVAIFPGDWDKGQVSRYMRRYHLDFPVIVDADLSLSRTVGATITPEVFVLGRFGMVYYHGAIDDWYYSLGRRRASATVNYVDASLVNLTRGLPPPHAPAKALGCYIFPRDPR